MSHGAAITTPTPGCNPGSPPGTAPGTAPGTVPAREHAPPSPPSEARLEANLAVLGARSARAAARIRTAGARAGLEFSSTLDAGALSATLDGRALCSRRRPLQEAQDLARNIDPEKAGGVVVLGFSMGHHVAAIVQRVKRAGVVVVFEPDAALLAEVLRRIDILEWARGAHLVLLTSDDAAEASESLRGLEPLLTAGVEVIDHAPSRARLGGGAASFAGMFARLCGSVRTHMVTTMMQTDTTVRNLLMNIDHYACAPGIGELSRACAGFPAIVVSAGPSLKRTIDLLTTPGLRDRCMIIAVQTVLKTLLARGIRPHFVTALDYHEVSRRFYEGLTESDVRGITLVAEPKANPAILQAYPGPLRLIADRVLEQVVGELSAHAHAPLESGATVAHLAYYLARHLGCDPVAFVGQDLAFTDGQYYARGAAIHTVWSPELNAFNTLEMMEWERIARNRAHLHRVSDDLGRPVYTDDQMRTYLSQFERDFLADAEKGLTTIDATGGGVKKMHTTALPLREVIERHARPGEGPTLPELPVPERALDADRIAMVRDRLERIRHDVRTIVERSEETVRLLERMPALQSDHRALNPLIDRAHAIRDELQRLDPAYPLVLRLNQLGAFKRLRADRSLYLEEGLSPVERQRRQIERDITNVRWIAEIAGVFEGMLRDTGAMLRGGPRHTRDQSARNDDRPAATGGDQPEAVRTAGVVIVCDPKAPTPALGGAAALVRTLERVGRIEGIRDAAILNPHPADLDACTSAIEAMRASGWRIRVVRHEEARPNGALDVRAAIGVARRFAPTSWRGGIGGVTVFDEVLADPHAVQRAAEELGVDAALCVGGAWALLDPALARSLVDRFCESPAVNRLCFSQCPPGLCGCLIERTLLGELCESRRAAKPFSLIGGLLCYNPFRPMADPIVKPCCISIDPSVRDAHARVVVDSTDRASHIERALAAAGLDLARCDAGAVARAVEAGETEPPAPRHLLLELNTDRAIAGPALALRGLPGVQREPMSPDLAMRIIDQVAAIADTTLTLSGAGDPLLHPRVGEILSHALAAMPGRVHLRTDGIADDRAIAALLENAPDVLSVDVLAQKAETYLALTGRDDLRRVLELIDAALQQRARGQGPMWVVPRITRCDAVYEEVELFYDKWMIVAGAAVIDQPVRTPAGARILPLGKPGAARRRDAFERLSVLCDGRVILDERDHRGDRPAADLSREGLSAAWAIVLRARRAALHAAPLEPDPLECGGPPAFDAAWTGW